MSYRWIGILLLGTSALTILVPPFLSSRPNAPYPSDESSQKVYYLPITFEPTHLDPALGYSEGYFLEQIYEPVFQYHYLKRPFMLEPLTCREMPVAQYFDKEGKPLPADADIEQIARVTYEIRLKKGIRYHPHPCFAKTPDGEYAYRALKPEDLRGIHTIDDFPLKDTRELVAADYVHQVKRLCIPNFIKPCPILAAIEKYIDGMEEFGEALQKDLAAIRTQREQELGAAYIQEINEREDPILLDLDKHPFPGIEVVDRYTFRIHLSRLYPQILYWMAMHFFAPVPPEATAFYNQSVLIAKNITLDRYPVGTGPFQLDTYRPNETTTLVRNPDYHEDYYPDEGDPGDREKGLLDAAGQRLPILDKVVYLREREAVPTWIKFIQGYYDVSAIDSANIDQGVRFSGSLETAEVGEELRQRGIKLRSKKSLGLRQFSFNMMDPVVGGYSEKQRKLRRAITIAMDTEEFVQIFHNGLGAELHGPVPQGIFGYQGGREGMNPYVFDWDEKRNRPVRKSIDHARKLLAEAGYPEGTGPDGKQLVLYYDNFKTGGAADAELRWLSRQFAKLNIAVVNRTTDYSSFANRAEKGEIQMCKSGWMCDYPDPENYLMLVYGPNGVVKHDGSNQINYENEEFDRLHRKMLAMPNTPERFELIKQMHAVLHRDQPSFSYSQGASFHLAHRWIRNAKVHPLAKNHTKYIDIDVKDREAYRQKYNRPVRWPIYGFVGLLLALALPALFRRLRKDES